MVPAFTGQTVCCGNDLNTEQAQPLPGFYRKNPNFETRNVKPLNSFENLILLYPNTPQKNSNLQKQKSYHQIFAWISLWIWDLCSTSGFRRLPVLPRLPHVPPGQPTLAARVAPGDSTLPPAPWNLGLGTFQVDRYYPENQIHPKLFFKHNNAKTIATTTTTTTTTTTRKRRTKTKTRRTRARGGGKCESVSSIICLEHIMRYQCIILRIALSSNRKQLITKYVLNIILYGQSAKLQVKHAMSGQRHHFWEFAQSVYNILHRPDPLSECMWQTLQTSTSGSAAGLRFCLQRSNPQRSGTRVHIFWWSHRFGLVVQAVCGMRAVANIHGAIYRFSTTRFWTVKWALGFTVLAPLQGQRRKILSANAPGQYNHTSFVAFDWVGHRRNLDSHLRAGLNSITPAPFASLKHT